MRFLPPPNTGRSPSSSMVVVGILFCLMGATIAAAGWASSRRKDLGEWVRHSHEVLEQTERTRSRLYEAQEAEESVERRERGKSLAEALRDARSEMETLDRLSMGSTHREWLRTLRLHWGRYEAELESLGKAPSRSAPPHLSPASTRAFRMALRGLDGMRASESRAVELRQAEWERAIRFSNLAILASGGAMAMAMVALVLLVRREDAARRREREAIEERMDQLRDLSLRVPVAAIHVAEGSLRLNEAARRMTGYIDEDVPTIEAWFLLTRGERADEARRAYEAERAAGFRSAALRRIRRKDGAWLDLEFAGYSDGAGEVWIFHDVTDALATRASLEEANRALSDLARTDGLTGLPNRRAFDEALARSKAEPLSALILDIDRFKSVNDAFGHDAGDAALRRVATVLGRTVGEAGFAARYGGEEFAVLIPGASVREAAALAERIRKAVQEAPFAHGSTTVSVGVATRISGAKDSSDLVRRADRALYEAKESGRNRVCVEADALEVAR